MHGFTMDLYLRDSLLASVFEHLCLRAGFSSQQTRQGSIYTEGFG
jgi:hypothetical protein